jgi:hypothetical protein
MLANVRFGSDVCFRGNNGHRKSELECPLLAIDVRYVPKGRFLLALPLIARHSRASDTNLKQQLSQRARELAEAQKRLAEALEQQTAASAQRPPSRSACLHQTLRGANRRIS